MKQKILKKRIQREDAMMSRENNYSTISVVIAALNEEKGISPTLKELYEVLSDPQFIVIDGNSFDRTFDIAKKMGAEVLLQKGKGKGDAIYQGINQISSNTRYVVFIDADHTYPAKYIPIMIEILEKNSNIGMVVGNRFNGEHNFKKSITNLFYIGNRFIAFVQNVLNGIKLSDPLSGLRVVRYKFVRGWKPESKGFDIEAEINFRVKRTGYKIVEIPIGYRKRLGEKKLKLHHGYVILKRILAQSLTI
jgi:dolichol-phosphate mannosyltransferase